MKYRRLGKTGLKLSEISLGTWQLGEGWGSVSEKDAIRVIEAAIDSGVNFFDTADVYGMDEANVLLRRL
jgi:aryl-alcohol dehydrogenase-like predicted oxidoreductase